MLAHTFLLAALVTLAVGDSCSNVKSDPGAYRCGARGQLTNAARVATGFLTTASANNALDCGSACFYNTDCQLSEFDESSMTCKLYKFSGKRMVFARQPSSSKVYYNTHCFEFGVLSPGERPPCDYIPYYAGSGHTMGGNRTPNTPYVLDGTTEEEACSALSACAANAETTAAGLFDLHYLRDAAHWECVTYQGGGGGSEPPFDVDNEDVTQAYGYDGACQK